MVELELSGTTLDVENNPGKITILMDQNTKCFEIPIAKSFAKRHRVWFPRPLCVSALCFSMARLEFSGMEVQEFRMRHVTLLLSFRRRLSVGDFHDGALFYDEGSAVPTPKDVCFLNRGEPLLYFIPLAIDWRKRNYARRLSKKMDA